MTFTDPSSPMTPTTPERAIRDTELESPSAASPTSKATTTATTTTTTSTNTARSPGEQRHDWAADRSPLQKLEVTLGGMSKEEKRAKVQVAEMRLKERLANREYSGRTGNSARPGWESVSMSQEKSVNSPESQSRSQGQDQGQSQSQSPKSFSEHVRANRMAGRGIPGHPKPKKGSGEIQIPKRGDVRRFERRGGMLERPGDATYHARSRSLNVGYVTPEQSPKQGQFATVEGPAMLVDNKHRIPRRPVGADSGIQRRAFSGVDSASLSKDKKDENVMPVPPGNVPRRKLPPAPLDLQGSRGYGKPVQRPTTITTQGYEPYRDVNPQHQHQPGTEVYPPTNIAERDFAHTGTEQLMRNENENENENPSQESQNGQGQNTRTKPKKQQTVSFDVPPPTPPPLFEWKSAPVARLRAQDFDFQNFDLQKGKAWWNGGRSSNRRKSRGLPGHYRHKTVQPTTSNDRFKPRIFLKCGPLLRYSGMKRMTVDGPNGPFEREIWRGSIMIVTKNSRSSYEPPPTLRLFSQPMDLLPPPPPKVENQLAFEYVDPTAGLMKMGRDGRPVYVKPVDDTEEEVDLSAVENDDGLYELAPSRIDFNSNSDTRQSIPANRIHWVDGEVALSYRQIPGIRLYADPDRDVTFWRFNIEVELGSSQQRIAYRINKGPAVGFWVPAHGQSMNIAYYSCNGFSSSVDSNKVSGPDPLWRDILNEHQTRPFHVMVGGGDQVFNDSIVNDSPSFQEWVKIKNVQDKYNMPFDPAFRSELEGFFLERYSNWFSQGLYSLANSQIPMVNIWNDHEIIEGYGSYPDEFMRTAVISGLGKIAYKYYLLFQHQSVPEETDLDEPSWLLGVNPGPYIKQRSRSFFLSLGKDVSLLGLDCRTERISSEILSEETCDLIWDRCHREITKGETKHLIVLSSIPIAYPRVSMVKNILNSKKSLGKAGIFGGLLNKHGGRVEIFDDSWTAKHLKAERGWLIEDLQDLAAEKSVRVTILSGDVHLAAIGRFYSNPKQGIPKDRDYRYMPNVISSAIADMPETEMISDMLNMRNKVHHMDQNTDEDILPIFTQDVDGKTRSNKRLLPRRNWCSIRPYQPGFTPPATPDSEVEPDSEETRPTRLQRTLSLTRGDGASGGGLLRRLSQRGSRPSTRDSSAGGGIFGRRRMSMNGPFPPPETGDSYFGGQPDNRPNPFLRQPTDVSQRGVRKATKHGDHKAGAPINLEGGLAITLNLEVNPKDPSGITHPYKLLVPRLWHEDGGVGAEGQGEYGNSIELGDHDPGSDDDGGNDPSSAPPSSTKPKRSWTRWLKFRRNRKVNADEDGDGEDDEEESDFEGEIDIGVADHHDGLEYEGYPGSDDDDGANVFGAELQRRSSRQP